jgi:peroxiredoxin
MKSLFPFDWRLAILLVASAWCLNAAEVGSPAPPLQICEWIRGDAVDVRQKAGTNLFVVVFWETGCKACRDTLPTLTELQRQHATDGVVLIAVSPESASVVKSFVTNMSNTLNFAIAADDSRKTYASYMHGFGGLAVPHAFVIDRKGTIAWHRHPDAGLRQAVDEMVAGQFDFEAEKRADNAARLQQEYIALVRTNATAAPKAEALGQQILADGARNPWLLNNFAWDILTVPRLQTRDLNLAMRAAKMAYESTGETNSAFADTYAHALFDAGKTRQAIELQKRAIELCTDQLYRPFLEKTLKTYEDKARETP